MAWFKVFYFIFSNVLDNQFFITLPKSQERMKGEAREGGRTMSRGQGDEDGYYYLFRGKPWWQEWCEIALLQKKSSLRQVSSIVLLYRLYRPPLYNKQKLKINKNLKKPKKTKKKEKKKKEKKKEPWQLVQEHVLPPWRHPWIDHHR